MSRKVILYIAQSLDGCIADPHGKVDWLNEAPAEDAGYAAFAKTIDTVILGHRTYCHIHDELSPAVWPYAGMQSYVLTHQDRPAQEGIRFVCQPVTALIHTLKQEKGKDIWICGGSRSARSSSGRARRAAVSVAAQCGECAKRRRVRAAANCCAEP